MKDTSAFSTLYDYGKICFTFLELLETTNPTRIISPSHNNYICFQYSKKYSNKFTNLPGKNIPERQDVFAFLKVGKLIEDIIHRRRQSGLVEKSAEDQKKEDEDLERKADEILRRDYGIER